MKKLFLAGILTGALAALAVDWRDSNPYGPYRVEVERSVGTLLVLTNDDPGVMEIDGIIFNAPAGTNTFSLDVVRTEETVQYGAVVFTNGTLVYTNFSYPTNTVTVTWTNRLVDWEGTNTDVIIPLDGRYVVGGDVLRLNWSFTNSRDVIINYAR